MEAAGLNSGGSVAVEMPFELAQGSTLETPDIVNKEKSESSGRPPTSLALRVA